VIGYLARSQELSFTVSPRNRIEVQDCLRGRQVELLEASALAAALFPDRLQVFGQQVKTGRIPRSTITMLADLGRCF